jgi:hypothetical protein
LVDANPKAPIFDSAEASEKKEAEDSALALLAAVWVIAEWLISDIESKGLSDNEVK